MRRILIDLSADRMQRGSNLSYMNIGQRCTIGVISEHVAIVVIAIEELAATQEHTPSLDPSM